MANVSTKRQNLLINVAIRMDGDKKTGSKRQYGLISCLNILLE